MNLATARESPWPVRALLFLTARRYIVGLIGLFVALCAAGAVLPQRAEATYSAWASAHPTLADLGAWTGMDDVFHSTVFLVVLGLTALSVLLSLVVRLNELRRQTGGTLWTRLIERPRTVGSMVFHLGLVGLVLGGMVSVLMRAEGRIILTESQTRTLAESYLGAVRAPKLALCRQSAFDLRLDEFHPIHDGRYGTPDYASTVTVLERGREVRCATVRVNEPLVHHGVTMYQSVHGFSTLITLSDAAGRRRFGAWVALSTEFQSNPTRYHDRFGIPDTPFSIDAEFLPDAYMLGEELASRSPEPRNPALNVTVRNGVDTVYRGPVYLGGTAPLSEGLQLGFGGVRYWSGFATVRDPGTNVLFVSAWISLAGLCLRFLPRRLDVASRLDAPQSI